MIASGLIENGVRRIGAEQELFMVNSAWRPAFVARQVLDRMPDFQIDEQRSRQYPNIGVVNGWVQMPASFTAGRRLATGGK